MGVALSMLMRAVLVFIAFGMVGCGQAPKTATVSAATDRTSCEDVVACKNRCDVRYPSNTTGHPAYGDGWARIDCYVTTIDPDKPWLWPA